jgi:proteasome lid subunit RPN8/RPN11
LGSGVTDGGVDLARRQLLDLVDVAGGAVEMLDEWIDAHGRTVFHISLDTSGLPVSSSGVRVRARERFHVVVGSSFPFDPPGVWSVHERWARTPHVQWGRYLCLYAATSVEWSPSDGMRGFIGRLSKWVANAAAGTLDPDGQPLHPPVAYADAKSGRLLVHSDLGDLVPWADDGSVTGSKTLIAWCSVNNDRRRVDVHEWIDMATAEVRAADADGEVFHNGLPVIAVPAVLTALEFGSEFPSTVTALGAGLADCGYGQDALLDDLAAANRINRKLRAQQTEQDRTAAGIPWDEDADPDSPLLTALLVGTPHRRIEGDKRLAHLAAWKLDAFSASITDLFTRVLQLHDSEEVTELRDGVHDLADRVLALTDVTWMQVMETRPEVTRRRDQATPASWLRDKCVLVLGAGALGAPVAELCVRAGVSALMVADHSMVKPGILVRQPYTDDDIGTNKAAALARRLSTISGLDVAHSNKNVRPTFFGSEHDLGAYDLVIDATADASVRSAIELARRSGRYFPPLITMVIGHHADKGLVTTCLRGASGAGADAFRKVSLLASSGRGEWADIGADLFPKEAQTDLFFPEPGCSSPTFVGSAAQTTALAGMMFDEALACLSPTPHSPDTNVGTPRTTFASAVRIGAAATRGTTRASWVSDLTSVDSSGLYEVRVSAEALVTARAEVRRGARTMAPDIETGGMLLGSFDDATGVVHVDATTGPPPDSFMSATYFHHGIEGTDERVRADVHRTASATGFIGFWHSHPYGPALPSKTDEQGMASIVAPDGTTRRALMMILGGRKPIWETWRDDGATGHPDFYVRVVPRSAGPVQTGHPGYVGGADLQQLPAGWYYRGGGGKVFVDPGANLPSRSPHDAGRPSRPISRWWTRGARA